MSTHVGTLIKCTKHSHCPYILYCYFTVKYFFFFALEHASFSFVLPLSISLFDMTTVHFILFFGISVNIFFLHQITYVIDTPEKNYCTHIACIPWRCELIRKPIPKTAMYKLHLVLPLLTTIQFPSHPDYKFLDAWVLDCNSLKLLY